MKLIAAAALTALLVGTGGCTIDRASGDDAVGATEGGGGDGDSQVVVEGEEVEQEPGYGAVLPYVTALASQRGGEMRRAQAAAADGSLAEAYMSVQADIDAAGSDAGYGDDEVGSVNVLDSDGATGPEGVRYRACYEDDDESAYCYTYADFQVNEASEVVGFTIDGHGLGGRVTVDGGRVRSGVGVFDLHGAYVTAHGDLAVVGTLSADRGQDVFVDVATKYRGRAAYSVIGAEELQAGEESAYALYFKGPVALGGVMQLVLVGGTEGALEERTLRVRVE